MFQFENLLDKKDCRFLLGCICTFNPSSDLLLFALPFHTCKLVKHSVEVIPTLDSYQLGYCCGILLLVGWLKAYVMWLSMGF
jgi:hypothetical protein